MLLHDLLYRAAKTTPEKVAFICAGERFTYAELLDETLRLAGYLRTKGIERGDRFAILLLNSHLFFPTYYAGSLLGATVVPINPRLTAREVQHILEDSESKALIYHSQFDEVVAASTAKSRPELIAVGASRLAASTYEDARHYPVVDLPGNAQETDIALQIYTSGTTGRPKGAMLSHRALVYNALTTNLGQGVTSDEVFLTVTPLGHAASGVRIYNLPCVNATHVTLASFDPIDMLATIERERVTSTVVVPTIMRALLECPEFDNFDLSSLRLLIYGAAPAPQALAEEASRRFPCDIMHGYGMTEGGPYMIRLPCADHRPGSSKLGSIGYAAEGLLTRIVDEQGNDVPQGEVGELIAKSDKTMSGYWKLPEATAAALRDGWLYTGDLAREDQDGYIYLVDRKKDMIISGGYNVYPKEIEDVLQQITGVRDVAVIGVSDEKWGEVPVAYIAMESSAPTTVEELQAVCRRQLAGYKRPAAFHIVPEIPRNSTGKIAKQILRSLGTP